MTMLVFAIPLLPGKEEVDRGMFQRLTTDGPERDAYVEGRRAQGFTREAVWHQETLDGTLAIVLLEGDDIEHSMGQLATSTLRLQFSSESSSRTSTAWTSQPIRHRP